MHILEMFNDIEKSLEYQNWLNTSNYSNFLSNTMTVQLTNKCNLSCECCFVINKPEAKFNYDKYYSFLNRIFSNLKEKHFIMNITGGEITYIDKKELFLFIYNCLRIANKHKIVLKFCFLTNLLGLDKDHFDLFELLKWDHLIRTSSDCFHHVTNDYRNEHILNVKKLNHIGIKPTVTIIVENENSINSIKNSYKNLDVDFILFCRKDYVNLENNYLYYLNTKHLDVRHMHFVMTYGYDNTLTFCMFPAGHSIESLKLDPDKVLKMEDISNYKLFSLFNYLAYCCKAVTSLNMKICPIVEYYKRYI